MPSIYYERNFVKNYYYHIYNRGANKDIVFKENSDYETFIEILGYYLTYPTGLPLSIFDRTVNKVPNLVESTCNLTSYCLMPNHFHLNLIQCLEPIFNNCIPNLMKRIITTYVMYFNKKYGHSGALFEGKYKNILVDHDSQLLSLTRYIHRNPLKIIGSEPLQNYEYSSYPIYLGLRDCPSWLNIKPIQEYFSKKNTQVSYKLFIEEGHDNTDELGKVALD